MKRLKEEIHKIIVSMFVDKNWSSRQKTNEIIKLINQNTKHNKKQNIVVDIDVLHTGSKPNKYQEILDNLLIKNPIGGFENSFNNRIKEVLNEKL